MINTDKFGNIKELIQCNKCHQWIPRTSHSKRMCSKCIFKGVRK